MAVRTLPQRRVWRGQIYIDPIASLYYLIGTEPEVERYLRIFSSPSDASHPATFAVLDNVDEPALSLSSSSTALVLNSIPPSRA
ncbi:hypothetical protein C8Q76DRAFT_793498 [Earliella scabrosa]|nr:hypothetical protein C8Q76DRAFT_793498 [Earliella scabrosa]